MIPNSAAEIVFEDHGHGNFRRLTCRTFLNASIAEILRRTRTTEVSGLGLAIAKALGGLGLRRHHPRRESSTGKGTRMTVSVTPSD